jgi:ATP-dependent helicase/nuclease subunit A
VDPDWSVLTDADAARMTDRVIDATLMRLLESGDPAAENLSLCMSRTELKQALAKTLGERWKFHSPALEEHYATSERLRHFLDENIARALEAHIRSFAGSPAVARLANALTECGKPCNNRSDKREEQRRTLAALFAELYEGGWDMARKCTEAVAEINLRAGSKKNWDEDGFGAAGQVLKAAREFLQKQCCMPGRNAEFEEAAVVLTCDFYRVHNAVVAAYDAERLAQAAIDYEDMINEALRLLREDKELRTRAARSLRFLLMDEFQDTDARQLEVARLLAEVPGGPDLFIVGDAKQSIYLFRGANVALFNNTLEQDSESVHLGVNYRSLPDVIRFINDFFVKSELLYAVENYVPMEAARTPMDMPRVEIFLPSPGEDDDNVLAPDKNEREARFIARRIREMCDGAEPLAIREAKTDVLRRACYDDIVLLFRRGSNVFAYESALREAEIPYNRVSGAGYFARREIQDVLALLKLVLDPWDEEALVTVLRSPLAGLSDESLLRMALLPAGLTAAFHGDTVPACFDQDDALEEARRLFRRLYDARETPPGALLRAIVEDTRIEAVLLSQHLGLQRVSNLRKMLQLADAFGQGRPAALAEFVRHIEDISVREIQEGEAVLQAKGMGAVTIMTIHKAKGLEFPVVFIPEMWVPTRSNKGDLVLHHDALGFSVKTPDEDGTLKHPAAGELITRLRKHDEDEESARLLYVAMTRARDYLVLCSNEDPKGKSIWASALNRTYDLAWREDGDLVCGDGWQATLRRLLPAEAPEREGMRDAEQEDVEAIRAAIAPCEPAAFARETISVSQLLYLMADKGAQDADLEPAPVPGIADEEAGLIGEGRLRAMARGTLAHRLFELWDFERDVVPDLEALLDEAGLGLEQRARLGEDLENMVVKWRASEHVAVYARAARIRRETPFLLAVGDTLVRGVVDAVVDDALVVDYKTGRPKPEHERTYCDQLLLYAAALRDITGKAPESAMLWYADYGSTHKIAVTDAAIDEVLARARVALQVAS